jgi:glycine C-acetyltransferase/8-amino-7-oxononanoate synthase
MTIHRRLEERLADFLCRPAALLFGSGYLAGNGVVAALARPGDVVFADELCHASIIDGCRIAGAETFLYDHLDVEHLAWGISKAAGRGALIATESVFSLGGDLAPLAEIAELGQRRHLRVLVDESHAVGALGAGGRGMVARAGLEDQVDVILGSLGTALGSYGAFVACEREMAAHLLNSARSLIFSSAPPPAAAAAALAALAQLEHRPELVQRLRTNTAALRRGLEAEGFGTGGGAQIVSVFIGAPELAERIAAAALERGVLVEAVRPPAVPAAAAFLRLTAMASHRAQELEEAAHVLSGAAERRGFEPAMSGLPAEVIELEADAHWAAAELDSPDPAPAPSPAPPAPPRGVFDIERLAA